MVEGDVRDDGGDDEDTTQQRFDEEDVEMSLFDGDATCISRRIQSVRGKIIDEFETTCLYIFLALAPAHP